MHTGFFNGTVTYGTLTAIMQLIGQVQGPFANISGYLPRWYAMTVSAERLMDVESLADDEMVRETKEVRRFYQTSFSAIELRNVSFTYEEGNKAPVVLSDFSMKIRKCETMAFTGHSGCARKSTVLKLLLSMYPPDSGEICLLSSDGEMPLDASWRRLFAYVPQGNALMNGTIREVVCFAEPDNAGNEERLRRALQIACADEFVSDPDAEQVAMMDLDAVYQEAGRHMLDAAAAMALESAGVRDGRSSMRIVRALRKTALFEKEKCAILKEMEQNGIWYMPFKGALVKDLYPKYGMREFSDHDILFDPTRRDDLREIMLRLGFSGKRDDGGVHDHYFKVPVLNFEMHRALFSPTFDRAIAEYYDHVRERLVKDPDNQFGCHFTPEDFYVYILAHAYKHFSGGGTGLRSLLDIYVILKETSPDMEKVSAELEKLGMTDFEFRFRSLSLDLFNGNELTEDELEMLAYMVRSGTYGTIENRVGNKISKEGGGKSGKWRYIFNRFFPTIEQVKYGNPFFYRHKILLPFLMPYRLLRGVLKRRAHLIAELKALKKF